MFYTMNMLQPTSCTLGPLRVRNMTNICLSGTSRMRDLREQLKRKTLRGMWQALTDSLTQLSFSFSGCSPLSCSLLHSLRRSVFLSVSRVFLYEIPGSYWWCLLTGDCDWCTHCSSLHCLQSAVSLSLSNTVTVSHTQ